MGMSEQDKKLKETVDQVIAMCLLAGCSVSTAYRVGAEFAKGVEDDRK